MGTAALALLGCDPACEAYWRAVCDECGESSGACESAREVADATLDDEGECRRTRAAYERLGALARARWCAIHDDGPADLAVLSQDHFICDGARVHFTFASIEIGDQSFPTYDLRRGRFSVHNTPSVSQGCEYHHAPHERSAGEVGLWIDCTVALGALGDRPTFCLRARP